MPAPVLGLQPGALVLVLVLVPVLPVLLASLHLSWWQDFWGQLCS
jgi:hypothetical protein